MKAKCGPIVTWHWAHLAADCDPWAEPDNGWHRYWQDLFPAEWREVSMGPHRADVAVPGAGVIEVQHSSIPAGQIRAREAFYGPRMVWVFDAFDAYENDRLIIRRPARHRDPAYRTFRWKHPRKSLAACTRPVFLDLGAVGGMFRLGRIFPTAPCGGWGWAIDRVRLVTALGGDPCRIEVAS